MNADVTRFRSARIAWILAALVSTVFGGHVAEGVRAEPAVVEDVVALPIDREVEFPSGGMVRVALKAGEAVEINGLLGEPSKLPPNARATFSWELESAGLPAADAKRQLRAKGELEIAEATPNGSKLLHALDPDVFLLYRAPVTGVYRFRLEAHTGAVDLFESPRWRETGSAPQLTPVPTAAAWPAEAKLSGRIVVRPIVLADAATSDALLEAEPNDTPEQAQSVVIPPARDERSIPSLHVFGTSDDVEYFDNGRVGRSGDDWFRFDYRGTEKRLLTLCLAIPDQQVAARVRVYSIDAKRVEKLGDAEVKKELSEPQGRSFEGWTLPLAEYEEGRNPNERAHQQTEQHRIAVNRQVEPGKVYFIRVEANAPAYDLELRLAPLAPFDDPRQAVRQALYDHIGQVDAWLVNRPRGASVERRIRDTGNLLGTHCMSCHTQSGVWGPAIPFAMGYRAENVQLYRDLVNTCYQSLRPTNVLIDAANNTSLQPLDLGDGPAGTRVTGHAVVSYERFEKPRKLQASQAIRCANFVLQSGDPGGINAAGPGANYGQCVVYNYAGEILWTAWESTRNPQYFYGLEEKAVRMLQHEAKFTDDMCHRIEFFSRYFPKDYPAAVRLAADEDQKGNAPRVKYPGKRLTDDERAALPGRIAAQIATDLKRLREIQNADGSWHFNPGTFDEVSKTWKAGTTESDPSPTAQALIAFEALGIKPDDPAVARGVKALLTMQHPTGYFNKSSQTGFVTTGYAMHALSRLFPVEPPTFRVEDFAAVANETPLAAANRLRRASLAGNADSLGVLLESVFHPDPWVRYWAVIGLGAAHQSEGVNVLVAALGDSSKPVREAAHWALRQTLIDDHGWDVVLEAFEKGDDRTREAIARTLSMRVDTVLTRSSLDTDRLAQSLGRALNDDPHPAVRAWAARAAWQWWVWNPPVRKSLNASWLRLLTRAEPNALVENCTRYQSQALFIANGHKANGSRDHQYPELAKLFEDVEKELADARKSRPETAERLAQRLVGVAATFFQTSGGDGGPGQMGYITAGSGDLFGVAVLQLLDGLPLQPNPGRDMTLLKISLEGAANVPHSDLQSRLIDLSLKGPEELRSIAAGSVSDPRAAQLVAVPELVEPLLQQVHRGAAEPPRRAQLSDPLLKLFSRVKWVIPNTVEQQREVLHYFIPNFDKAVDEVALKAAPESERTALERQRESDWYLASGLGDVLGENPDFRFDATLQFFPENFSNAHIARYWLPSIPWLLTYKKSLPEVSLKPGQLPPVDPLEELRSRALRLFLTQLKPEADPRNRELATRLAGATALRLNPEVLSGLAELVTFEKREHVLGTANNLLSTGREKFLPQLLAAVKKERPQRVAVVEKNGQPALPDEFVSDFAYFRDYVIPEMNRVLRSDEYSCMACHGVPGRVPPLTLHRPDDAGYLPVDKLLENYRLLQDRVNTKDLERSKLLRKPLNVENANEDGHQGGRRYQPTDPGYLILRKWAENQVPLQKLNLGASR